MASFLAGPAAHLVGAGLQAVGAGIPVSDNCNKLLEGMRGAGLPVPPKNWFKAKGNRCQAAGGACGPSAGATPKRNVYDTLESHIQGLMQVVKPVMEFKNVIASGCKSADRGQRAGNPCSGERAKRFTRQRSYSNDECCCADTCRPASPPRKLFKRKQSTEKESRVGRRRRPTTESSSEEDSDDDVFECMYCSRSRCSMLKLPCGRAICPKCAKTEDHERQCKQCKKLLR